jgi:recombinational DNA repair protein RecR
VHPRKNTGWTGYTPKGAVCRGCQRRISIKPDKSCNIPEHAEYYQSCLEHAKSLYPSRRKSTKPYRPMVNWTYKDKDGIRLCKSCNKGNATKPGKNCNIPRHNETYLVILEKQRKNKNKKYKPLSYWTYIDVSKASRCKSCNKLTSTKPSQTCTELKHKQNYIRVLKRQKDRHKRR